MTQGDLVNERYEIVRELGRGGAGVTYLARDARGAGEVVLKVLRLDLLQDWKSVELLEREAAVLKSLHHERIPAYVDSFQADVEGTTRFVLVRQYVEGSSLQARVEGGWRATEVEIRQLGARLLSIVAYIHSVRPPVIHRDINPRNIIQRADGEVFLLDFGGVQDAIRVSASGGSTIIGTPGYMPLEQFSGRATTRSDLYAAAATILFLLTHRNPTDLPTRDMKIDVRSVIEISSPGLSRVLGNWLEPDEARRTLPIEEAIPLLQGVEVPHRTGASSEAGSADGSAPEPSSYPPHGSHIAASSRGGALRIVIPERGIGNTRSGGFGVIWLGVLGFWTYSSVQAGAPLSFSLVSLPFWFIGIFIISRIMYRMLGRVEIEITHDELVFTRRFLFLRWRQRVPIEEVGEAVLVEGRRRRRRDMSDMGGMRSMRHMRSMSFEDGDGRWERRDRGGLLLELGARTVSFGQNLSLREQEWLRDSINARIRQAREQN